MHRHARTHAGADQAAYGALLNSPALPMGDHQGGSFPGVKRCRTETAINTGAKAALSGDERVLSIWRGLLGAGVAQGTQPRPPAPQGSAPPSGSGPSQHLMPLGKKCLLMRTPPREGEGQAHSHSSGPESGLWMKGGPGPRGPREPGHLPSSWAGPIHLTILAEWPLGPPKRNPRNWGGVPPQTFIYCRE